MTHNAVLLKTIMTFLILALLVFLLFYGNRHLICLNILIKHFVHTRDETLKSLCTLS